jgi:hypothetical protein
VPYDLVLCECVCGRRQGFPLDADDELAVFVCDKCFLRFSFSDEGVFPARIELTDPAGRSYPLGFRVFSLRRASAELAEEVVESWFKNVPGAEAANEDPRSEKALPEHAAGPGAKNRPQRLKRALS